MNAQRNAAQRFVICDIEATGLGDDKEIIEIALITIEDDKVIDVYQSLVNPLTAVSTFIQDFTSISVKELEAAPKFYDIAEAVKTRLEGAVFVSHNTDFDYGLLKKKYEEMGQELRLKTFCTLKVAQEEIPGLTNYNLDALCSFFRIKNPERHRALGDARAALDLFRELGKLRLKVRPKVYFHPHHEKDMGRLTSKPGLLLFKDTEGKVIHVEVAFDMVKRARELLEIRPKNRDLLIRTTSVEGEATGSALIAEFRKLLFEPLKPHWMISVIAAPSGEKEFRLLPVKKGQSGFWFFKHQQEARRKLQHLQRELKDDTFAYREGSKSKEEIFRHNQKVDQLIKEQSFPNPHILLLGEGRVMGERSLVLIRDHHVLGYGYTMASEEEIESRPEAYLTRKFHLNLGADQVAIRYLKVLKNFSRKTESWKSLAQHRPGAELR